MQPAVPSGWEFVDSSTLTYFIPLATDFDAEDAFRSPRDKGKELLETIQHRDTLFFDESVDVYLALRTPAVEDAVLRSSLGRLVISLEAKIVNSSTPDRDSNPASEVIYLGTVQETQHPVLISQDKSAQDDGFVFAVWKLPVFLSRPRIRLQGPSAVFTASASLKPAQLSLPSQLKDGYLPSGVATGLNLLESFSNDPALNGVQPRLSALRVSRVAPLTQQAKDMLQPIKSSAKQLALRIFPAVHSRIRFARPNTTPPSPAIIAMLEVDFTPFFECEIALTAVRMTVPDGTVQDLNSQPAMSFPMSCVAHDHITFLHRITPEAVDTLAKNPTRDLTIQIEMTALEQLGVCTPKLTMAWTTSLDFTLPVNPGFGSAMQPIQRSHRPSQLSINSITSLTAPAVPPDSLPSFEASNKTEATVQGLGVTVTFTGPPPSQKIYPGDIFVWSVFVVNRLPSTSTAAPRKLALLAIPKRRRNESRVNRPPSVSHAPAGAPNSKLKSSHKDRAIADAVLDDNVVHAMQRSSVVDSTEVVSLSADIRVGPLAPGSCHIAELRFLALKSGIVGIEAVRILDLGNTEHVDIRELPTVFVEQPKHIADGSNASDMERNEERLVAATA
ncbi:TRAPP trafficking subunit Trs65-domain-containing protein [Truncatella angustata]|uniref:TRAPP trafficking subunit Trs65-domain-containing protein n=1 Tax=Truncatella angustata TaxID=152316 RepID=A0A9P8UEG4_9PEZI|nr:TRAPP trafficking subunit Trs65-domain-containing protein [Truncatella angustata]KAH6648431.1 TRAPP trafficking subunit Trs65-domain-containing protein [Truncatella angustata]KAH8201556.1 hypothetical protein TruAng_004248 [Truncatella angustata]